jgi:hypothetical protein
MTANVRVYDQLRETGHFWIEILMLLLVCQGQPFSLKTKLYMLAQAHTAIGYTRCWVQYYLIESIKLSRLIKSEGNLS